jgi:hypothetical protein
MKHQVGSYQKIEEHQLSDHIKVAEHEYSLDERIEQMEEMRLW